MSAILLTIINDVDYHWCLISSMVPMLMMSAILLTIISVKLRVCRSLARSDDEIKIFAPLLQPHTQFLYQQLFCDFHIVLISCVCTSWGPIWIKISLRRHCDLTPLSAAHVLHWWVCLLQGIATHSTWLVCISPCNAIHCSNVSLAILSLYLFSRNVTRGRA